MAKVSSTSCSIFVGNLPYDASEEELRELFSQVGNVTSVRVVCDKDTRQPKGYAFCDFADSVSVQAAIEKLNNVEYNGRKLRVDGAERELHTPIGKPEERGPLRAGGGPRALGGPSFADLPPPTPVPSVADRMARLREQEAQEQARAAAADLCDRAEIARLMETLTPTQLFHILGEMQRVALCAPEVARALVSENVQLALAIRHAEFLVGLVDDPVLPTEPGVKERARSVRESVFTTDGPVVPPPPPPPGAAPAMGPGPPIPSEAHFVPAPTPASMPLLALPAIHPLPSVGNASAGSLLATPSEASRAPQTEGERRALLERLVQLSPAQIDQLPHHAKVGLLEYLQTL